MEIYQLILIVVSIILIKSLFSSKSLEKNTYNIPRQIKAHRIINKEVNNSTDNRKRVTFNLDKNKVYEIKKFDKNIEHSKGNYFYGDDIINNNTKNIENVKIESPQQNMLNRLHKKKDDILENTKDIYSYWENLNIGNFTDRNYLNNQVNDFNKFKTESNLFQEKEISKVYDELTKGKTNPYINLHDDSSINSNKTIVDGFSTSCKYHSLNNIEN